MRTTLFAIQVLAVVASATSAQPTKENETTSSITDSTPKNTVHIVIKSDAQARQIFTYFPYPRPVVDAIVWGRPITGLYRLEVNHQGSVTAVTILKSAGRAMDVSAMKTFIRWRARPGPLRIVDVGWAIGLRGRL